MNLINLNIYFDFLQGRRGATLINFFASLFLFHKH